MDNIPKDKWVIKFYVSSKMFRDYEKFVSPSFLRLRPRKHPNFKFPQFGHLLIMKTNLKFG